MTTLTEKCVIKFACAWSAMVLLIGGCGTTGNVKASDVYADPQVVALAEAAARGDARRVARLAAEGVDVDARGDKKTSLLEWALLNRSKAGLAALLDAGADPAVTDEQGNSVVHLAAMSNDPDYLRILLDKGADPNTPNDKTGATPIFSALMGTRDEQLQMLLTAGADPARADRMGNTPLHLAAKINAFARTLDLLEAGAPPEARNQLGTTFQWYFFQTPEHLLTEKARRERAAVVDWLRRHDIAVEGPTAL